MYDTVNLWIDRVDISGGNTFEMLPYLNEVTERQNERVGYSCTGKAADYTVCIFERGISMKGSLPKYYRGNNIDNFTLYDTRQAIEKMSDHLHIDINIAKVTRFDFSTVIQTQRTPSDYYSYLGNKPYFNRLLPHADTLYYNNHKRQIIFYDKRKEAKTENVQIPEIFKNSNLLRYELRYLNHLKNQFNGTVTAQLLKEKAFYKANIENWYNEFKTIQKLKPQNYMLDNITTIKDAEEAIFCYLLQKEGEGAINDFMNELKANSIFKERPRYSELKSRLNKRLEVQKGEQRSDLMQELEKKVFNHYRYAL